MTALTRSARATSGGSTAPPPVDLGRLRRARWVRRLFLTLLALFIVGGAVGLWGVREQTTKAAAQGWSLEVTSARITRAGLAVPLEWTISRTSGFSEGETVVLRVTDDYFDLLDENSVDPTPSKEWTDGEFVYWEFDTPHEGDTMTVSLDTRTGSSVQLRSTQAETAVVVEGEPVVTVRFSTWVMP